jgi:hypothetical protein
LLDVGPRKDVYKRFNYDPEQTKGPVLTSFDEPQQEDASEWQRHPEWSKPKEQEH